MQFFSNPSHTGRPKGLILSGVVGCGKTTMIEESLKSLESFLEIFKYSAPMREMFKKIKFTPCCRVTSTSVLFSEESSLIKKIATGALYLQKIFNAQKMMTFQDVAGVITMEPSHLNFRDLVFKSGKKAELFGADIADADIFDNTFFSVFKRFTIRKKKQKITNSHANLSNSILANITELLSFS